VNDAALLEVDGRGAVDHHLRHVVVVEQWQDGAEEVAGGLLVDFVGLH
jgi:hypothetical protein